MEFDAPEDVKGDGGNFLKEPGTYHVAITNIRPGEGPKGNPIDGFTFEIDVLAGTTDGCAGKTHRECLFAPNLSNSESSQTWAKKKLAAFFIAANVMSPDQLGKPVNIDETKANGQQLVIKFAEGMEKDDAGKYTKPTGYLEISFADMFHVDDPEVKDVPKNEDALSMIDQANRHEASWFAFKQKKNGVSQGSATVTTPAPAAAASEAVDVAGMF